MSPVALKLFAGHDPMYGLYGSLSYPGSHSMRDAERMALVEGDVIIET